MAQRTVCLCDGKYIGIESIYTVVNGEQINIKGKVEELRIKSRSNKLFCPCGCGANLTLVAPDNSTRERHFRLSDGTYESECHVVTEGKASVDSKIVLKCWLDDKLQVDDIESRVPISNVGDTNRKYEFTFLSRTKNVAVSYTYDRVNLSDEKFDILKVNSTNIQLIYITDIKNSGNNGQYPEALMKIQDRQGYCLLLAVEDASYSSAILSAVFYAQDNDGYWKEISFAEGPISDFTISEDRQLKHKSEYLSVMKDAQLEEFNTALEKERTRREKEKQRRMEEQKHLQEEAERRKQEMLNRWNNIGKINKDDKHWYDKVTNQPSGQIIPVEKPKVIKDFSQNEKFVIDENGNRWLKCLTCGKTAEEAHFVSYYKSERINMGVCKICSNNRSKARKILNDFKQNNGIE